jgi:hypothetical protein
MKPTPILRRRTCLGNQFERSARLPADYGNQGGRLGRGGRVLRTNGSAGNSLGDHFSHLAAAK